MTGTDILRHRLSLLPGKTGLVLQRLFEADLLSAQSLGVILDAGDLAGDCNKLLGFAIAHGELRAAGAPVADALAMARRLGARISLSWSAKRWKAEHDRFARAETLKRLSAENVHYDLSKFDAVINAKFPGYLIRTSRRLGMEGLRQRHCVASYHDRIKAGHCAIASVLLDSARWTVELRLTGDEARPLTIGQIKAHCNRSADSSVKEAICGFFGASPQDQIPQFCNGAPAGRAYMENVRRVLPALRPNGVARVVVSFEGCGDSGSISGIWFGGSDFDAKETLVETVGVTRGLVDGQWVSERGIKTKSVYEAIEDITYDYLEETGVNWYDNDGGFGDFVIDLEKGTVALDVITRFTESETAFAAERDIETGEPVD